MNNVEQLPAIPTFPESLVWINGDPSLVEGLSGRVVLFHFWDFTNHVCLDSLVYVRQWHTQYESLGVQIIGVHSPAFDFAHSEAAVQTAVRSLGITYPVVLDNQFQLWDGLANQVWPGFHVVAPDGRVVYRDFGAHAFLGVEAVIQDQLAQLGRHAELPPTLEPLRHRDEPAMPLAHVTPDFVMGYEADTLGNHEGYDPHRVVAYSPHRGPFEEGRFYLEGKWLNQRNCVAVAKSHEGVEACLAIPYVASEVNVIINPAGEAGFTVDVTDNGGPLTDTSAGESVRFTRDANPRRSQVVVSESGMYRLVRHDNVQRGVLRLYAKSSGFSVYGVSFGAGPALDEAEPAAVAQALMQGRALAQDTVAATNYVSSYAAALRAAEEKKIREQEEAGRLERERAAHNNRAHNQPASAQRTPKAKTQVAQVSADASGTARSTASVEVGAPPGGRAPTTDAPTTDAPTAATGSERNRQASAEGTKAEAIAPRTGVKGTPRPAKRSEKPRGASQGKRNGGGRPPRGPVDTDASRPASTTSEGQPIAPTREGMAEDAQNRPPAAKKAKQKPRNETSSNKKDVAKVASGKRAPAGRKGSKFKSSLVIPSEAAAELLRTKAGKRPRTRAAGE